jgi:Asp-tRNA(Asn)/Glu-tRNA(Gln) amidotransferase A subunit family amidase
MAGSRREFLAGSVGVMGAAMAGTAGAAGKRQTPSTPGAPPAFGTAAASGPKVTPGTIVEAEKLVQVSMSPGHVEEVAGNWQSSMAALLERRVGPRKVELGETDAPGTVWIAQQVEYEATKHELHAPTVIPRLKAAKAAVSQDIADLALPDSDEDIAFAPVSSLSWWIWKKKLSSVRLTQIYLERLKHFDPKLRCVITLCEEHALEQAKVADAEIAAGKYRGPLHGIPWGAKDLLDTKGIRTTWGAEFYRDRVPAEDAAVTKKLNEAGAVLVAKLSLGALALNDIWFGGQTKNPWNLGEGASGSSAGPGAAVAAGLVGFAIGSETQGSIISPSMRCGVTGLRPTFGRVPRTGAMTLSWTCDKLGAMARSVEDTALVLAAISGYDAGDTGSVEAPAVNFAPGRGVEKLRVGYVEKWMQEAPATDVDRHALEVMKGLGMTAVPVELPDWPYDSLNVILFAESAAAFEAETLDGRVDELRVQTPDAWPNTFRQSRFLSAVDFVQADRLRRKVAVVVAKLMETVDVLLVPSLRDEPLVIFNFTGHPSLTLRAGFVEVSEERSDWAPDAKRPLKKFAPARRVPYGVTLVGQLFEEDTLFEVGVAMEKALGVSEERPVGF